MFDANHLKSTPSDVPSTWAHFTNNCLSSPLLWLVLDRKDGSSFYRTHEYLTSTCAYPHIPVNPFWFVSLSLLLTPLQRGKPSFPFSIPRSSFQKKSIRHPKNIFLRIGMSLLFLTVFKVCVRACVSLKQGSGNSVFDMDQSGKTLLALFIFYCCKTEAWVGKLILSILSESLMHWFVYRN